MYVFISNTAAPKSTLSRVRYTIQKWCEMTNTTTSIHGFYIRVWLLDWFCNAGEEEEEEEERDDDEMVSAYAVKVKWLDISHKKYGGLLVHHCA